MRFDRFAPALLVGALALVGLSRPAVAGGADLALLPSSGSVLLHIDLARLRGSVFYKEVLSPLLQNPNLQKDLGEARQTLGFDPINDLSSITVVMNPPTGGQEEALIIVDGKLNKDKLVAMAQKEGQATKADHNGAEIWVSAAGKEDMALTFVGNKAVLGKQKMVRETLDASKGAAGGNAQIKPLLNGVNQNGDVWFVANLPDAARAELAKGNPMAQDLKTVTGSIDFAKGLALVLSVGATAEGAKKMATDIQAAMKLDPQTEPMMQQMGVLPIIQKLKVEAKGANLNIGLELSVEDVNKLKMLAGMATMGMMGGGAAPPMMPEPVKAQ